MDIEIKDSKLCLPLETIIRAMGIEQKREALSWLASDAEVINTVVSFLSGEDELGWSTGDPNLRQRILAKVEEAQLKDVPKYNWAPWDVIRQRVRDIRSSEHIYWVLYHKLSDNLKRQVMDELRRIGVESNYTTDQGNADIEAIKGMIKDGFTQMQSREVAGLSHATARIEQLERERMTAHASLRELIDLNETTGDPDPEVTNRARALLPKEPDGVWDSPEADALMAAIEKDRDDLLLGVIEKALTFPKYVRLYYSDGRFGHALMHTGLGQYVRNSGDWEVQSEFDEHGVLRVSAERLPQLLKSLFGTELQECSQEEHDRDC